MIYTYAHVVSIVLTNICYTYLHLLCSLVYLTPVRRCYDSTFHVATSMWHYCLWYIILLWDLSTSHSYPYRSSIVFACMLPILLPCCTSALLYSALLLAHPASHESFQLLLPITHHLILHACFTAFICSYLEYNHLVYRLILVNVLCSTTTQQITINTSFLPHRIAYFAVSTLTSV